jgi:hypothetical protein
MNGNGMSDQPETMDAVQGRSPAADAGTGSPAAVLPDLGGVDVL